MATKKQAQATKVRVLVAGAFGQPDDVVELDGEALAQALASGQVDAHPEAVAYAESLR
jgi:ABC-type nitrate/sulfonate/bicarbonate transport system substrate-binding protein